MTINIIRLEPGQDPPETVELQLGALGKRIPDPSTMLADFGSKIYRGANGNEHLPWNDPILADQLIKAQDDFHWTTPNTARIGRQWSVP